MTVKRKPGRPPGAQTKIGTFKCPRCGPSEVLYRHGAAKSDGQVCLRQRRCQKCGFEAPAVEVLVLGAGLESALAGQIVDLTGEVKRLLHIDGGGDADECEPAD